MERKYRTGEVNYNNYNSKMTIVEYCRACDIVVEFENGYKVNSRYDTFKSGNIKSPYDKSVYGVGFIGEGKHIGSVNGIHTKCQQYWKRIIERSYSKDFKEKNPTYEDITCCNEWLNFQNFGDWYDENYYEIANQNMAIDKDILHKGNKIYNPDNCVFVLQEINNLFTKSNKTRGDLPIGVTYDKVKNKYISQIHINDKIKKLGRFNTPIEAFNEYKIRKEQLIKDKADEYKNIIPSKLYDALYCYNVEITD